MYLANSKFKTMSILSWVEWMVLALSSSKEDVLQLYSDQSLQRLGGASCV